MRQGCPLSPILFNILIDMEEKMAKRRDRVILTGEKIYTLAYADDLVRMTGKGRIRDEESIN